MTAAGAPGRLDEAKARLIAERLRGGGSAAAPVAPITPRSSGTVVPLSADQRQVWLHAAMAPDMPLYNESITIHRIGSFDPAALTAALNAILRRHESWRTAFVAGDDDQICQRVCDVELVVAFDDVGALPPVDRDAAARAIGAADALGAFDLATAPLIRARVVRLAPDEHRLYLTLHHLIFDGVSIYRVIVPELAALYAAFAGAEPSPLPDPVLQYGDYAVWQQARLASPQIARQLDYWRRTLADAPRLALHGDRPRPAQPTHAGSMEVFELPHRLTEALKALSAARGVTLYMTLLAVFKAMLFRYTGQEDIVIGGVTDLRRRPELDRVVGYFLNTFALRSMPTATRSFAGYLVDVRDTVLGALAASEVPFDLVVASLGTPRLPGGHPLFDVLFSIEPPVDPFPDGWDLTQMDITVGAAKFDLYLELDERPDGMICRFLYGSERFDPATIRAMAGHWQTMLAAVVADPDQPIGTIPLLGDAERRTLLVDRNPATTGFDGVLVPQAIAAAIAANPDAVAIEAADGCWTYARLGAHAAAIAARLRADGAAPGDLIGIAVDRSPTMVAALLAVMAVGAAWLPIDRGFPAARLERIVTDAAPSLLLIDAANAAVLPDWSIARIVVADDAPNEIPRADPLALDPAPTDGRALAYVLYTSGSTGAPKGVEIEHAALANLIAAMRETPGFAADGRLLAITTLSFDIAALELLLPLVCGGRLIMAPRDEVVDPARLAALIETTRPTMIQATPAMWRGLVEEGWGGDPALTILCGGEALSRDLAELLLDRAGAVWNMYGPTETTIWSLVERVARGGPDGGGPVAIGRPIANTTHYILDPGGNPVPIGAVGELYLGGAGLARGYRNLPALTAERFALHAFTSDPGTSDPGTSEPGAPAGVPMRLYRTGDQARHRRDGVVEYLGRADAEEKIRGYRVAVEEVEGALASHPAIAAAAVRSWPDPAGSRALCGYLVAAGGVARDSAVLDPAVDDQVLRAHLARTLPDYMVPAQFVWLPALPMTPNAKLDRAALPPPIAAPRPDAPPQGETEEKLAAIWQATLGVDRVGRHDGFFELGGHSLLVARLLRRVEQAFGRRLTMAAFFRAHHLDAMAAMLDAAPEAAAQDGAADTMLVALQPLGTRPPMLWLDAGPTFLPLAHAIGTDRPFLGVPVDPILEQVAPGTDFPAIARQIVDLIRRERPDGPYLLGGWCTSGILAYEVARQLRAAGADVPLLVLAHAVNPADYHRIGRQRLRLSKGHYHLRQLWRGRGVDRIGYLKARAQGVLEALRLSRARTAAGSHGALRGILDRAADIYDPPAYTGAVILFQPSERVALLDTEQGWARVANKGLTVHEIAGDHRSMLRDPAATGFGALLADALEAAAERGG